MFFKVVATLVIFGCWGYIIHSRDNEVTNIEINDKKLQIIMLGDKL